MRIVFVVFTDYPEGDAAARRVHTMAKGLASRSHEVSVLVPQRFRTGPLCGEIDGIQIRWGLHTPSARRGLLSERLRARRAALVLLNRTLHEGIDWLVLYNLGLDSLPMLGLARRVGTRVATDYSDIRVRTRKATLIQRIQYRWQTLADGITPRLADLNIVISHHLKEQMAAIAPNIPNLIIPPLVDTDRFVTNPTAAQEFRRRWEIGETIQISYLGGFWNVDGVAVLLRAAAKLAAQGVLFKLVISGAAVADKDCDDVPALVRDLRLEQRVVLTGWLPTDQVIACMSAADILVVPKIDHIINQAGVPTKLAEYCAMGRAIVVSQIGDISLYLQDGKNAFFCQPGDELSLSEALQKLIADQSLRNDLASNARAAAVESFDYKSAACRIESALMTVADHSGNLRT